MREQIHGNNRCHTIENLAKIAAILPKGQGAVPRLFGRMFQSYFGRGYIKTRHGAKIVITPCALDSFTTMAMNNWAFDYWVFDTCAALLGQSGVFYDIGANIGYMSIEMAQISSDQIAVFAFEPHSELADNIVVSAELNKFENLSVAAVCVGDMDGTVKFIKEKHSVHGHVMHDEESDGIKQSMNSKIVSIDSLRSTNVIPPPDVIKIDVEGFEYNVLRGARSTIREYKPSIVFEMGTETLKYNKSPIDYFEELLNIGNYRFEVAVGTYREPVLIKNLKEFDHKFQEKPYLTNIVAKHEDVAD